MTDRERCNLRIDYRLVLLGPRSDSVYVEQTCASSALPCLSIPFYCRHVEEMRLAIKRIWGMDSLVLDLLPGQDDGSPCAIVEIVSPDVSRSLAYSSPQWMARHAVV